jgi:transposase
MTRGIFFIAIDVDDNSFHGCGVNNKTGEIREFRCRPTIGHLDKKLAGFKADCSEIKICYEATYLGFSLCRALGKKGYFCEVIAPSLIPEVPGKKVKTDRIDSRKMAVYYSNGQLTGVHVPTVEDETARDLVRSRKFVYRQMSRMRLHVLSACRRMGINYHEGEGNQNRSNWTLMHRNWLTVKIQEQNNHEFSFNMSTLLKQIDQIEETIKLYDDEIKRLAEQISYREKVSALCSYRGIDVLTAMTLTTELGDINRFSHPRQLSSYAGMDLVEYSSGGHERRYGISKMGNKNIRTSVIESCQMARQIPKVSKILKARRRDVNPKYIEIADRCMNRLYVKSKRLLNREKTSNKVKVACAREMLCFVWESLKAAS